jgi:FdhD protein
MKKMKSLPILRISDDKRKNIYDNVITETHVTLLLNDYEIATIICTPEYILELATGYLFSERFIQKKDDMIQSEYDDKKGIVKIKTKDKIDPLKDIRGSRFITPGCISPGSFYNALDTVVCDKVESQLHVSQKDVITIASQIQKKSILFKETGGAHGAALFNSSHLLFFVEDIGRHNALDKIIGRCILKDIPMNDKLIFTSGRISSAVLLRIVKASIPILISRSAPTTEAVELSKEFGITLIGFARVSRFNLYSNEWRISD